MDTKYYQRTWSYNVAVVYALHELIIKMKDLNISYAANSFCIVWSFTYI